MLVLACHVCSLACQSGWLDPFNGCAFPPPHMSTYACTVLASLHAAALQVTGGEVGPRSLSCALQQRQPLVLAPSSGACLAGQCTCTGVLPLVGG